MIKKVYFATTNENKIREAHEILGIDVEGTPLEVDEVQSLDPIKVALKKAHDYFEKLKKPIIVEDNSLVFSALGKLPGTYICDFYNQLGNKGLVNLLRDKANRRCYAQSTFVYINKEGKGHIFVEKIRGTVAKKPRGNNGFGWDPIFIPNKKRKTFAEMSLAEKNKYSMRAKALKKLKRWLK